MSLIIDHSRVQTCADVQVKAVSKESVFDSERKTIWRLRKGSERVSYFIMKSEFHLSTVNVKLYLK